MITPTFNPCPPSVWDKYLARREFGQHAHRLVTCTKCGGKMMNFPGPHSPHWRDGHLVDCVGDRIENAAGCGVPGNPAPPVELGHESPAAGSVPLTVRSSGAGEVPSRGGQPVPPAPETTPLPAERDAVWPGSYERGHGAVMDNGPELARVTSRIGRAVLDFCRPGRRFHAAELHAHVKRECEAAPASADRVLRELRANGSVAYRCIDRSQSLYIVEGTTSGAESP